MHVDEHPSRSAVCPSSQPSTESLIPSPQMAEQIEDEKADPPEQVHPVTGPRQFAKHLSVPDTSPSSQNSLPTFHPSPQIGEQTETEAPTH